MLLESTPDAQPRDDPTHQGEYLAELDWRVDLKDNMYRYNRLVQPVGHAEETGR